MLTAQSSALDLAELQFTRLATGAHGLALDGGVLGHGLPECKIPLIDLRPMLLKRRCTSATKGTVWSALVRLAHDRPEPWAVAATGMMMPGMKKIGGRLGTHYPGDLRDLDSAIVEGFLHALDRADPAQPRLHTRLYGAAFRYGYTACVREGLVSGRQAPLKESIGWHGASGRFGHPDLVLAGALRDGVVTRHQADLLVWVHLDHARRADLARRLGVSPYQIGQELAVAERGLASYLRTAC